MSALARYFKYTGRNVAGYDKTSTPLTDKLIEEGIDVHFDDDIRHIPTNWKPEETIAVYTPALPADHKELSWFKQQPIGLFKRAKILGMISNEKKGIAVAGTHGKTTTSTMVANLLYQSQQGCGAFLGGISKNFGSNLVLPKEDSPWIVVEADEFDRSFLHLKPNLALVTSVDADHLDIYGTKESIEESFKQFCSQVDKEGKLIVHKNIDLDLDQAVAQIFNYGLKGPADFCALNLRLDAGEGIYHFDLRTPGGTIAHCRSNYPGLVNVENAIGAAALSYFAGASADEIKQGLESYQGVARRFDICHRGTQSIYIDDYAHHPEELKAVITSVRDLYPGRKVLGIFQPHLYSRTNDFAEEFAESLDMLDETILIPLYPAREEAIEGVSSELIFRYMKSDKKFLMERSEVLEYIGSSTQEVILTLGAGDIDRMVGSIQQLLKEKNV